MAKGVQFAVSVIIDAIDNATKPLNKIENKLDATSRRIARTHKILNAGFSAVAKTAAAATAAAGLAAAAAIKLGADWIKAAGDLQDFGAQIGWRVEDIQSWRYAAEQAGVSNEAFDKGIQRMSKNIAELRTGSGALYSMLERVGDVEFMEQLKAAKGGEALDILIRKMEMLEDQEAATLLATQAFGRSGLVMTGLAAQGSPALDALRRRAYELGMVLSQDTADAADRVSDKMATLRGRISGVGNRIMTAALPAVEKMVDRIDKWIDANQGLLADRIADWIERVAESAENALPKVLKFAEDITPAFETLLATVKGIAWYLDKWQMVGGVAAGVGDFVFDYSGEREQRRSEREMSRALRERLRETVPRDELNAAQRQVQKSGLSPADAAYWSKVAAAVQSQRRDSRDGESQSSEISAFLRSVASGPQSVGSGTVDVNVNIAGLPEGSSTETHAAGPAIGRTKVSTARPAGRRRVGG